MFQESCEPLIAHCPNSPVARAMGTHGWDLPKLLPLGWTGPSGLEMVPHQQNLLDLVKIPPDFHPSPGH